VEEVQAQVEHLSAKSGTEFNSPEAQREFLDKMANQEILAAEAERLGYQDAPEVIMARKRAMMFKLLTERIGNGPRPGEVTEELARKYYQEHPSEFGPPDKAKVALIRVQDAEKASEVMGEVERQVKGKGVEEQFQAFSDLVQRYTNEPGARDVNLSLGLGATGYPKEVSDAAAGLKDIGGVSAPIATEDGYFILQLKERTPGSVKPFEQVRAHVLRSVSEQIRDRRVAEVVDELSKKLDAHVFKERYSDVHFDRREASSAAPARP
jgi:hypothetical protein